MYLDFPREVSTLTLGVEIHQSDNRDYSSSPAPTYHLALDANYSHTLNRVKIADWYHHEDYDPERPELGKTWRFRPDLVPELSFMLIAHVLNPLVPIIGYIKLYNKGVFATQSAGGSHVVKGKLAGPEAGVYSIDDYDPSPEVHTGGPMFADVGKDSALCSLSSIASQLVAGELQYIGILGNDQTPQGWFWIGGTSGPGSSDEDIDQWDRTRTYKVGELARRADTIYRCTVENTGAIPEENFDKWTFDHLLRYNGPYLTEGSSVGVLSRGVDEDGNPFTNVDPHPRHTLTSPVVRETIGDPQVFMAERLQGANVDAGLPEIQKIILPAGTFVIPPIGFVDIPYQTLVESEEEDDFGNPTGVKTYYDWWLMNQRGGLNAGAGTGIRGGSASNVSVSSVGQGRDNDGNLWAAGVGLGPELKFPNRAAPFLDSAFPFMRYRQDIIGGTPGPMAFFSISRAWKALVQGAINLPIVADPAQPQPFKPIVKSYEVYCKSPREIYVHLFHNKDYQDDLPLLRGWCIPYSVAVDSALVAQLNCAMAKGSMKMIFVGYRTYYFNEGTGDRVETGAPVFFDPNTGQPTSQDNGYPIAEIYATAAPTIDDAGQACFDPSAEQMQFSWEHSEAVSEDILFEGVVVGTHSTRLDSSGSAVFA